MELSTFVVGEQCTDYPVSICARLAPSARSRRRILPMLVVVVTSFDRVKEVTIQKNDR
jgi:hypothetical protein